MSSTPLSGQAVDQVVVDVVPERPGLPGGPLDLLRRLPPVDELHDVGTEVLHPDADAVEAPFAQRPQVFRRGAVGVGLEAEAHGFGDLHPFQDAVDQPGQRVRTQEGRRAAPQVQLRQAGPLVQCLPVKRKLGQHGVDVAAFDPVVLGDPLVAAAVGTELLAEGQVDVEAEVAVRVQAAVHGGDPLRLGRGHGLPVGHRWVAGVPRDGAVVFLE